MTRFEIAKENSSLYHLPEQGGIKNANWKYHEESDEAFTVRIEKAVIGLLIEAVTLSANERMQMQDGSK